MRIGLLVMCLLVIFSFTFASQSPYLPVADPEPPTMEFRVNEYRNMVIAAWVLGSMVSVMATVLVTAVILNSILIMGLMTALIVLTAVSLLWMAIVRAVSHGIDRTLRQSPDAYGGSEVEKQYRKWRERMLWPWLMTTIPLGAFLVLVGIIGLLLFLFLEA